MVAAEVGISDLHILTPRPDESQPDADELFTKNAFSMYSTGAIDYESSQRGDNQKVLFSARTIPIYLNWGFDGPVTIVADKSDPTTPLVALEHEENAGFDLGLTTRGKADSLENQSIIFRLDAEVGPKLDLNFIKIAGILNGVSIYADDTFRGLMPEERIANFLNTGVAFNLSNNFGFTIYYKVGRDAPTFQKVESFNFGISGKM
jgi:hypothetical protein